MKITKVIRRIGRTINTGNYSSLRVEAEFEAEVTPEDKITEVSNKLRDGAFKIVQTDLKALKDKVRGD